jgi:hypothetical protein
MLPRIHVALLISFPLLTHAQGLPEAGTEAPTPTMRVVERDWQYFKTVPCSQVNSLVAHSRSEELLLARRKQQCVDRYKAFMPNPVIR